MHLQGFVALCCAGTLGACSGGNSQNPLADEGLVCTTDVRPGIVVEIRDGSSGAPIAETADGEAIDMDGTELELEPYSFNGDGEMTARATAYERPGRYRVNVRHNGYANWTAEDVTVEAGACHVTMTTLQADLEQLTD